MYDPKLFKQRLVQLKKESELTYEEVAEFADISSSMLDSYLYSGVTPRIPALWAIADVFRVSIDYLVGRSYSRGTK